MLWLQLATPELRDIETSPLDSSDANTGSASHLWKD
jgi:hypothetical protein